MFDPRLDQLFKTARPHERFLADAMSVLLASMPDQFDGKTMLDHVILSQQTREPVWTRILPETGKPLSTYSGQTLEQLQRQGLAPTQIAAIKAALENEGINASHLKHVPAKVKPLPPVKSVGASAEKTGEGTEGEAGREEDTDLTLDLNPEEPKFAGRPLSELLGKTDAELLKIEGIGPATVKQIRAAEAAK